MVVFLPRLKQKGYLDQMQVAIASIGSRKLTAKDDHATQGWGWFAPNLTIYGFDADADACEAAIQDLGRRQVTWREKHLPLALSHSAGESILYVTRHPMCSSLYPPNEPFLSRFDDLPDLVNLDFIVELPVTTLDAFCQEEQVDALDFLQIDVQGADLDVLRGSTQILPSVLAIQIEVEFAPIYLNQPLFADIDHYLRQQGFSLFHLGTVPRVRARSPVASQTRPGQLLWGEGYYLRDLLLEDNASSRTPAQLLKLACIADVMDFPDYALELLEYLTVNYGSTDPTYNLADVIVESLTQFPDLVAQGLANIPVVQRIREYLICPDLVQDEPQAGRSPEPVPPPPKTIADPQRDS